MNTTLLWAALGALGLALIGWLLLRRRTPSQRPDTPRARTDAPAGMAGDAPGPAAAAAGGSVAAQHQAATEALRQARRRKAEDEARQAAEREAQRQRPAPAAARHGPPAERPPLPGERPLPGARPPLKADEPAAEPVVPVLSPLAIHVNVPSRAPVAPAGLAPLRPPARPAGPPTVLVADDSKVVRIKTGRLLEQQGWRVLLADDGQAALRCLDTESPDLLITDVEMPGLDGFELTRRLRASPRWARLPVIMITSSDDKHRAQAAAVGVNVLLGKPYAEQALLEQAQLLLGSAVRRPTSALH